MFHERFGDDVRGIGFGYGHSRDLGTTGFIARFVAMVWYPTQAVRIQMLLITESNFYLENLNSLRINKKTSFV